MGSTGRPTASEHSPQPGTGNTIAYRTASEDKSVWPLDHSVSTSATAA